MTDPDVVVLRQKIHGMNVTRYADALCDLLPDHEVVLAKTPKEEREYVSTARVATGYSMDTAYLDHAENLELFACVYAGTDHLDVDAFAEHGVAVTNAAGVHVTNVSEYAVGAVLSFAGAFPTAWRRKERREWRKFKTTELSESTVAVIGLGAIGSAVVDRLEPFGVDTVGVRYSPEKGGPTDEVYGFDDVHAAVADAEFVVVACPLTDLTEGLVDEELLWTMHPDATLVNVARGEVVDTEALVDALRESWIGAAALDVTDPEPLPEDHSLWGFDNVMITPHIAGHTPRYFDRCAEILAENLRRLEAGETELRNQEA